MGKGQNFVKNGNNNAKKLANIIHTINEDDEIEPQTPLIEPELQNGSDENSKTKNKKKKDSGSSSSEDDVRPEKAKWNKRRNEIDELKKIFFEFLMGWQAQSTDNLPY